MKKIKCQNPICESTFHFNDKKNPNATKVRCPKCKGVQPLELVEKIEEEEVDWLRSEPPKPVSSPVIEQEDQFVVQPKIEEKKEDFFMVKPDPPAPIKRPTPAPSNKRRKPPGNDQLGWIVIHDEHTAAKTFELRKGINRIGRQSKSTKRDVNISIKTADTMMSRHHCDIEVRWNSRKNEYEYALSDYSANGTFINAGVRLARSEEKLIQENDTIQIGRTKVVFRLSNQNNSLRDIEQSVRETEYLKTIIT
jgi:FOG: FHA domain